MVNQFSLPTGNNQEISQTQAGRAASGRHGYLKVTRAMGKRSMKKILIVDDQSEVRELVSVTLEDETYEILTAANGFEALEVARRELPALMLLDVMMPRSPTGFEICQRLKSDTHTRDIYIIMLTSQGHEHDKRAGFEAGADDYFVKPFSPLELMQKVDEVLSSPANWQK